MSFREIHYTFGPETTLREIQKKYSERQMILYRSVSTESRFMLLDVSGKESIFKGGLSYQVYQKFNFTTFNWDALLEMRYLTLDNEEQKVFHSIVDSWDRKDARPFGLDSTIITKSEKHNFEYMMLNFWEGEEDFMDWDNATDNALAKFGHAGNKGALVTVYKKVG